MKPKLYVPDYIGYAQPFRGMFEVVYGKGKNYDIDVMKSCDFLLLTGGEDIDPKYYGHEKSKHTQHFHDNRRDACEWALIQEALATDIPIIGICRGAQWLTIASGGHLIQHVTGHNSGTHLLQTSDPTEQPLHMSSAHHQMCDLHNVNHILHAWTEHLSQCYLSAKEVDLYPKGLGKEPEVFYIPSLRGFGVQGHPEYLGYNAPANVYIRDLIANTFMLEDGTPK